MNLTLFVPAQGVTPAEVLIADLATESLVLWIYARVGFVVRADFVIEPDAPSLKRR